MATARLEFEYPGVTVYSPTGVGIDTVGIFTSKGETVVLFADQIRDVINALEQSANFLGV